jgi:hypothetical protein
MTTCLKTQTTYANVESGSLLDFKMNQIGPTEWNCLDNILQSTSQDSLAGMQSDWATGWTTEKSFDSRQDRQFFLFLLKTPKSALGPTQPPIRGVPEALSTGWKRKDRETDYSLPSNADIKNEWCYTSKLSYSS